MKTCDRANWECCSQIASRELRMFPKYDAVTFDARSCLYLHWWWTIWNKSAEIGHNIIVYTIMSEWMKCLPWTCERWNERFSLQIKMLAACVKKATRWRRWLLFSTQSATNECLNVVNLHLLIQATSHMFMIYKQKWKFLSQIRRLHSTYSKVRANDPEVRDYFKCVTLQRRCAEDLFCPISHSIDYRWKRLTLKRQDLAACRLFSSLHNTRRNKTEWKWSRRLKPLFLSSHISFRFVGHCRLRISAGKQPLARLE